MSRHYLGSWTLPSGNSVDAYLSADIKSDAMNFVALRPRTGLEPSRPLERRDVSRDHSRHRVRDREGGRGKRRDMSARLLRHLARDSRRRDGGPARMMTAGGDIHRLDRATFRTSRLLDYCERKELIAQTGHEPDLWPLVVLKELVDNALDACEDTDIAPEITVTVGPRHITVADNGPGLPVSTIAGVLDFSVRVSSREAYIAPDRGAQGNALKTLVAMPFVLDGSAGGWRSRRLGRGTTS